MRCVTQQMSIGKLWTLKNRIDVDPPYQREAGLWSPEKNQLFMDSLLNQYDVPKLYFHDRSAEKGPWAYSVIDGKQRLTAVWQGFFFFMVLNGTIVFGKGPVRWLGVLICAGLAVLWWKVRRRTES